MKRLDPKIRKLQLREIAISLAITRGYQNITLKEMSRVSCVSKGLIINYFKTIPKLKQIVMTEAVKRGVIEIVAQGLGARNPIALKASKEIKDKAVAFLTQ